MDIQKRPFPQIAAVAAVILTALLFGLLGDADEPQAAGTTQTPVGEMQPTSTESERADRTAAQALDEAVDALIDVGSYAFEAKLLVSIQDEPTEVELEGWVNGSDRELTMTINRESVTTRVIDGVATVERDGETVEVALEEAGEPPSILILKSTQNPTFEDPAMIVGKLNSSDLASSNFDVNGAATVEVRLDDDGNLAGYTIVANNESWSVEVKLFDIGELLEVSDEVLDYIAAVRELLEGTDYEDAVAEGPDVFIATGYLFCEQLAGDVSPTDVLTEYVETLTGSDIEQADDDELALAGTILGTAVGFLCPEHTELIEEGS